MDTLSTVVGLLGIVIGMASAGAVEKEIIAFHRGNFKMTSEVGVSPLGRTSYLFKVMSCSAAIIAMTDIVSITKSRGRYFMIFFGKKTSRGVVVSIQDSCFKCPAKKTVEKNVLACDEYKPFWISWDNVATVRVGQGMKLGENLLLEYTSAKPFKVRFSQVTTLKPPAKFRFILQEEVIFTAPLRDGSTTVAVKEDVAVGSVVYEIVVKPEVDLIMLADSSHFKISGTELRTTARLDFEKERFYLLRFKTKELNINITMTILVEDVNDETPEVVLGDGIRIPEELPVGFIVGGVFTAKDRDVNDSLTYTLEGQDSAFLSVIGNGQLRIERRIDRDGPHGRKKLNKLTLHVEDNAHHDSAYSLTIIITDINDNVPTCTSGLFSKIIKPSARSDKPIMNIPCSDEDSGSNGQFSLRIVPDKDDHSKRFWLSGVDLFADIETLRKESSKRDNAPYILKLLAVDTPKKGRSNTGTAVVIINLPHRKPPRVNDYKPKWVSAIPDIQGNFPNQVVPESAAPGTLIERFVAEDQDPGTMVAYIIASVKDDTGKNDTGPFLIDLKTGQLRTSAVLDSDPGTGGVKFYKILIMATDGEHVISGYVKVIIKNTNDNPPRFNKTVHVISAKAFKNFANPILQLDVQDYDKNSDVTLSLEKSDHRYFRLSLTSDKWLLKFRPGYDPRVDTTIPPVITITASDNGSPPRTSQTVVVLTDLPCPMPTSAPTTAGNNTANPTKAGMMSRTPKRQSGETQAGSSGHTMGSSPQGIQVGVEDYDEGSQTDISNIPKTTDSKDTSVCVSPNTSQQDRTGLYLKVACAVEGLIIVMTTSLVLAKKCGCLKKSSAAAGQPELKEPLGCENALRNHDNQSRNSLKKKDSKNPSKPGRSSATPTPTLTRLDVVNEVPEPSQTSDAQRKSCMTAESSSTSAVVLDDEMTLTAKNKFLGLRKKTNPPVEVYSNQSGVCLYDTEMVSVARTKFLEQLKEPTPVVENEPEMVFIAKDKFMTFLGQNPTEAPPEMMNHLASDNSEIIAVAKDKFKGLTKDKNSSDLDVTKETPPLDILSLLEGTCFSPSDDSMITVAKGRFLDMLKENEALGAHMTSNDAILEYAAGYNPSTDTVYIAKDKFFNLIRKPEPEKHEDEILAVSKDNLMELIKREVDPWADRTAAVLQCVSGIDPDNGVMFIAKQKFLNFANKTTEEEGSVDSMVAVTKPKLAEILQRNDKDPKCNETLNHYVAAISPSTGMVYMTKQKFLSLAESDKKNSKSDEVLEVDRESLEELVKSRGGNKDSIEAAVKAHTLGQLPGKNMIYIPKSKFLHITSGAGKSTGGDVDENGILEVSKDTIDHMTECTGGLLLNPIATNQSSESVFITKKKFLELASQDYEENDMIMLTKEKAAEIQEGEDESFWKKNALAFMPSSGKIYMARTKFMDRMKQKRSSNQSSGNESGDELVSVPKEQLNELLCTTGDQRANTFIRQHAEAFNPKTGAIYIARKKFFDTVSKKTSFEPGKEEDEVVSVPKDILLEMVNDAGDAGPEPNLSKYALALSGDNQTAFIAKRKFIALGKSKNKHDGAESLDGDDGELVAVTEESLSQLAGDEASQTGDLVKRYAKAFNPQKKVAYLAKDQFLKLAKNMEASINTDGEKEEMIAVPKEKLVELTKSEGNESAKSKLLKHALAFNDTHGMAYVAKSHFMKLVAKNMDTSTGTDGEKDEMIALPKEKLAELANDGIGSAKSKLIKHALAFNDTQGTAYVSKRRFMKLIEKSKATSSKQTQEGENEMVTVSQDQLEEMLTAGGEVKKAACGEYLKKVAMAMNPLTRMVYLSKNKFTEIARKSVNSTENSTDENDIVGVPQTQMAEMLNQEGDKDSGTLKKYALAFNKTSGQVYFLKKKLRELASLIPKSKHEGDLMCESIASTPSSSNGSKSSANLEHLALQKSQGSSKVQEKMSTHAPDVMNEDAEGENTTSESETASDPLNSDLSAMLKSGEFNVLNSRSGESDMDQSETLANIHGANGEVLDCYHDRTDSEATDDSLTDTSGDSILDTEAKPRVVLTITDDMYDDSEVQINERQKLKTPHTSMFGKLPTREGKKKKKVKAWDAEVRNRLFGTAGKDKPGKADEKMSTKKIQRRKSKVSPENDKSAAETSDINGVPGKKKRLRKKSGQVYPEADIATSETDEGCTGNTLLPDPEHSQKTSKKSKKKR